MRRSTNSLTPLLLTTLLLAAACSGETKELAPKAEKLEEVKPKSAAAQTLVMVGDANAVEFKMDAAVEKIRGKVPSTAVSGTISIDPTDLSKSTGLLEISIKDLELFQTKDEEQDGTWTEETKSDLQNEHARAWLEISADAPEAERTINERVQFSLTGVSDPSVTDLTKQAGAERKVTFTAAGDFLLHGRKSPKQAKLEATFTFDGENISAVHVKTVEPVAVSLAEHDVRPREAFGKFAQATLQMMSPKVAGEALVSLDLHMKPGKAELAPVEGKPALTKEQAAAATTSAMSADDLAAGKQPDAAAPAGDAAKAK
jgi:polyisoprenoid-binding protein YceI